MHGFVTDVEAETVPKGLNEEVVRLISEKKREPAWLLEWRLKAYRTWLTMTEPTWQNVHYPAIDYQDIIYYSAPKKRPTLNSLDEVDPEIRATFEKLGIPLEEQKLLAGVAVDAVFDSVSVGTTFRTSWRSWGSSSVPSPTRCRSIPISCGSTRAPSCRIRQLLRDAQLGGLQ